MNSPSCGNMDKKARRSLDVWQDVDPYYLRNIGRIRRYLDPETSRLVVHVLVPSRLDNVNSLLHGAPAHQARIASYVSVVSDETTSRDHKNFSATDYHASKQQVSIKHCTSLLLASMVVSEAAQWCQFYGRISRVGYLACTLTDNNPGCSCGCCITGHNSIPYNLTLNPTAVTVALMKLGLGLLVHPLTELCAYTSAWYSDCSIYPEIRMATCDGPRGGKRKTIQESSMLKYITKQKSVAHEDVNG